MSLYVSRQSGIRLEGGRDVFLFSVGASGDHPDGHHDRNDDREGDGNPEEGFVGGGIVSGEGQTVNGRNEDSSHDQHDNNDGNDTIHELRDIHFFNSLYVYSSSLRVIVECHDYEGDEDTDNDNPNERGPCTETVLL